jgi:hypothetical protein
MNSIAAGTDTLRRRPRWRAYLLLSRVSNLPTVWTNVLAGCLSCRPASTAARICV